MTFKICLKQDDKGAEHESKHLFMSDMEMHCSVALLKPEAKGKGSAVSYKLKLLRLPCKRAKERHLDRVQGVIYFSCLFEPGRSCFHATHKELP